jgi:hypothetical protein
MQPINQILKEIGLPIWICWGFSIFGILVVTIYSLSIKNTEASWFSVLPITGMLSLIITMGMILYSANDYVKRKKSWAEERERHAGELIAIRSGPVLEERKTVTLDKRLQSIDGIIGYLDQSMKMGQEPKDLTPILLALSKEVKNIRDRK